VWCAATGEPAYLPTALLYFDFDGPGGSRCHADSNGLAAGATLGEAVLQGFLEVVERDAVAIWWYNRLRVGEVDTASFGDRYVDDVIAHYASLGRRAWVMDLTSDLGIPVFAAVSARAEAPLPEVIFGFGSHLDPGIALRRCITEMSQMLATVRRPPEQRRAQLAGTFDDALSWWGEATLEKHPYLLPDSEQERRGVECFENTVGRYEGTDARGADVLSADLDSCLAIAGRTGLRVYVRDVTRADLGIPVAKVVVPELRHFWRRLAPGRLFQVPVGLGRRAAPAAESDMNPVSLFV
jgi:ribosomal protein S12 methylthiotransferase accessory factor